MALDLSMKNDFWAISFEFIGELDSYFIHRYIIIKYKLSSITNQIHNYNQSYGPLFMSMPYLCKFGNSGGIRVPWTHF